MSGVSAPAVTATFSATALTYPGAPYLLSETPWRIRKPAPLIGEHNLEVFEEELGLSRDRILLLKQAGVI